MANQNSKSLLDAIDPNASSDDEDDQDFSLPETRPSKRRKGSAREDNIHVAAEQEVSASELEREKAERLRKADVEWQALLKIEEDAKKERMASSSSLDLARDQIADEEMVNIRRPRNFAGEIIYETVNLPASHPDVKRYRVNTNVAHTLGSAQGQLVGSVAVSDIAMHMDSLPLQAESPTPGILPESDATAPATNTTNLRASASLSTAKDKPRPGPVKRKRPRQSLESMNAELNRQAAAAKKMSTFEKSQMDWKQLTSTSATLSTDLEANRRAGGFLEKQDFLGRVAGRREDDARGVGEGRRRK